MAYKLQCTIALQDCPSLYPRPSDSQSGIAFTNASCVRDQRLQGNVGRCGFPGAHCTTDSSGHHNCALPGLTVNNSYQISPLCRNGICMGAVGSVCTNDLDCNFGINCNGTSSSPGVCGGAGAPLETEPGLNFTQDYCLSGSGNQNSTGYWSCSGGPPMVLPQQPTTTQGLSSTSSTQGQSSPSIPSPSAYSASASPTPSSSSHKSHRAAIAGGLVGVGLGLALLAAVLVLMRRRARRRQRPQIFFDNGMASAPTSVQQWPMNSPTPLSSPYTAYSWRDSVPSPSYVPSMPSNVSPISSPNYFVREVD